MSDPNLVHSTFCLLIFEKLGRFMVGCFFCDTHFFAKFTKPLNRGGRRLSAGLLPYTSLSTIFSSNLMF